MKYFEKELATFENADIKELAEMMIVNIPDYFFHVPASSTGKYHPQYALGDGGLYRHTCALLRFMNYILSLEMIQNIFDSRERDLMRIAGIMHDSRKSGEEDSKSQFTVFEHPLLAAEAIRRFKDRVSTISNAEIEIIAEACEAHMGQWSTDKRSKIVLPTPTSKYQMLLHLADYLASRKDIEVLFDDYVKENFTEEMRMPFGKYKGMLLTDIAKDDSDYLKWVVNNTDIREPLKTAVLKLVK